MHDAHAAFYSGLLDEFLEAEADLHISLGDLTNDGTAEELRQIYGLLKRKPRNFIHVLGNHDLYAQTRAEVLSLSGQQRAGMNACLDDIGPKEKWNRRSEREWTVSSPMILPCKQEKEPRCGTIPQRGFFGLRQSVIILFLRLWC